MNISRDTSPHKFRLFSRYNYFVNSFIYALIVCANDYTSAHRMESQPQHMQLHKQNVHFIWKIHKRNSNRTNAININAPEKKTDLQRMQTNSSSCYYTHVSFRLEFAVANIYFIIKTLHFIALSFCVCLNWKITCRSRNNGNFRTNKILSQVLLKSHHKTDAMLITYRFETHMLLQSN